MFVGAEGTLGIITEGQHRVYLVFLLFVRFVGVAADSYRFGIVPVATIRLAPLLPTTVAIAGFPSVEHAVKAVGEVINSGVPIRESRRARHDRRELQ